MRAIDTTIHWAKAHERHLSALSLAGGFAFDSYTFGRIDRPLTQLVFIVYLIAAGAGIAVLHVLESRPEGHKPSEKTRTILVSIMQFALGCLLSGFCVFYIRSASVVASWPFLLCMAGIFIANEYLRRYHSRLVFSALLFFLSLYSYAILLVPVVIGVHRHHPVPDQRRHREWWCSFSICAPWRGWVMKAVIAAPAPKSPAGMLVTDHGSDQRLLFPESVLAASLALVLSDGRWDLSRRTKRAGRNFQVDGGG